VLKSKLWIRWSFDRFLCSLVVVLALLRPALAQRAMPDPALLPSPNPLCDGRLVPCLVMDDFAGHAFLQPQVLPATDRRDTAAVLPFGLALGLAGRVAGGLSTHFAFWKEGDALYQQLGPLRLNLTVRLLPVFPLWSGSGDSESDETGQLAYTPPRGFRLGLSYEHEVRVWRFDGANSLGLLTDLASLRLVASWMLGPVQLAGSVGALYDWGGLFATGEAAAQVGLFLPFFKQLKVYAEALGRGVPAFAKADTLLPGPEGLAGQDPIHPQSALGLGLSFHPHARLDLGVSVHGGFGGLAPWTVSLNLLTLSVGKTYQARSATPALQVAAEVAREFGTWAVEQWKTIDPYLKHDCVLYDDNHQPTGRLGELSPDRSACIYKGLRVPIGPHFWHNKADTLLCNDKALKDCFLLRDHQESAWEPIHPLLVRADCFAYYNGQPWMRVGKLTADKQGCERDGHLVPVGQTLKPEHDAAGHYCYDEPDKAKKQTRKLWCLQSPEHPQTGAQYLMRRWAGGIDRAKEALERQDAQVTKVIDEGAQGVPLHATTPVREAEASARELLDHLKNATLDDAGQVFHGVLSEARKWLKKPLLQQAGDLAESAGDTMASPSTYIPGGVLGRETRLLGEGAEAISDAARAGKTAARAARAAEHVEHALLDAVPGERKAVRGLLAAESEITSDAALRRAARPPKPVAPTVDPRTGREVGRFVVDPKGNAMVEPRGGRTVPFPREGAPDTHTLYPNGSNYQRLNPVGHPGNSQAHGHGHLEGTGAGRRGQGPAIDPHGQVVPFNSAGAHWPIK